MVEIIIGQRKMGASDVNEKKKKKKKRIKMKLLSAGWLCTIESNCVSFIDAIERITSFLLFFFG